MTKKESFLQAMLQYPTVSEAAKAANIARSTAYKYLEDSTFKKQLSKAKADILSSTATYLQQNLALCSEELIKLVKDETIAAAVKVQAINAVFANARAMTETADIVTKLIEIEERMKDND